MYYNCFIFAFLDGKEIIYELREHSIDKYIPSYDKFNITNVLDDSGIEITPPDTGIGHSDTGILYLLLFQISY